MPLIPKPNYNQIFASQAPDQDKPAVFNNYPEGWGPESRPNNGKPTIKGFNYLQQTSDLKDLWILQNGACLPYDESIEYTDGAPVLKDGVIQYKTASGFSPAISDKPYVLNYFTEGTSYPINARVTLDSGDIVQSTVEGNTTDPNADMTGWVKTSDASQIFTLTALNQELFNLSIERKSTQHSVHLVDYLTRQQWLTWKNDNASVDMTVALEAAVADLKSKPANGISIGLGEIILPKGNVYLNTRQVNISNMYGIRFRGQGASATRINTNLDLSGAAGTGDSLLRFNSYIYLEFCDLAFISNNQNTSLLRVNGNGGGRELLFDACTTNNFKYLVHHENTINEDTNFFNRCSFGSCKSVVYSRNSQAVINTVLHCTFGEPIEAAFNIVGYGYTTIIGGNVVCGGKFYYVPSDKGSYYGQIVTMIGTKFEYGLNGKQQVLTTDNNPNTFLFAKLINCGFVGGIPDAATFPFDVAGKIKIEIDGGQWTNTKFRFGQSTDYNCLVEIKNCSEPPQPANISWLQYQAGFAYAYPLVKFSDNYNKMDFIVRNELTHAAKLNAINAISFRGAALLQGATLVPTTHTVDIGTGIVFVNSLKLIIKRWNTTSNLRVSVFSDAAYTVPMNTEQVITLPTATGSTPMGIDIPLTVKVFTGKMYIRVINDTTNAIVYGHFSVDTEFL